MLGCIYVVPSGVPSGVYFPACTRHFLVPLLCVGCARVRIPYKKARRRKNFMLAHFSPIYVVRNPAAEHIFAAPPIAISLHTFPLRLRAAM